MSTFFEGRVVVNAEELQGPRVYSTDLVPTLDDANDPEGSVTVASRSLKIKIITKGLVTLNSAYLVSPLAVRLLEAHPDLLTGPAILPAFRTDKDHLMDLVASTGDPASVDLEEERLRDHIALLEQSIQRVMPWDLGNVAERFRKAVIAGLRNPDSIIAHELAVKGGVERAEIERIAQHIESLDLSNSINMRRYVSDCPDPIREPLSRFTAACYHIVGTDVVRCETGTDLSPLSDFKAADVVLAARDYRAEVLSDEAIFLEVFLGFALDTIQSAALPSQIVDSLSFNTVHQLSGALRNQGFQEKYDGMIKEVLALTAEHDARVALDRLDEEAVAAVARDLAAVFQKEILHELPNYKTQVQTDAKVELYRSGAEIARDAIGVVPVLSNVVAFTDAVNHAAKAGCALERVMTLGEQPTAFAEARRKQIADIKTAIGRLGTSGAKKGKLLDAVALLSDVHGISIRRA